MHLYIFRTFYFITLIELSVSFSFTNLYENIKYYSFSVAFEQCDNRWVKEDISGLTEDISKHVFGQELATETILAALKSHSKNNHKKKPLVLNFHGWPGGGKGYVAEFIANNWFKEGKKSKFVKTYVAKNDFPLNGNIHEYQKRLQTEIEDTVRSCCKALFVFDEVDKYPPTVLDGIKSYLEYNTLVSGLDFREAIFIFITNTGEQLITQIVLNKFSEGILREELEIRDFERHLKKLAYNDVGGFFGSALIKHHLIDHIVPFLPLERRHVELCIKAELKIQGGEHFANSQAFVSEVMEELVFGPEENDLFSTSGCKHVDAKVAGVLEKHIMRGRKKSNSEL